MNGGYVEELMRKELVYKPGSVHWLYSQWGKAIHLGCLSPSTSSDLPGNDADHIAFHYLVLLQVGFTLPLLLPVVRCAL